jgi:DNA-binding MarR family transcriptional regulator
MGDMPERMARAVNVILNRYLVRGADGMDRPLPYNPVDYQTLRFLAAKPKARATDVADHLGVAPTTMQSALDRLVKKGLLTKAKSETDGRARLYALTEKGIAIHAAIEAQDRANMAAMLSALNPVEQAEMVRLIERVVASE